MQYRRFGKADLVVSEICFGPMKWSDVKQGQGALDRAIDLSVNVIHSSYEYQTIHELGNYLAKHPKRRDLHHIIKIFFPRL